MSQDFLPSQYFDRLGRQRFGLGIEALRNQEYARTVSSSATKVTEVSWHCTDIVRNEHPVVFRSKPQDLRSVHAP